MKLLFENWRKYINENTQISEESERLLGMLVNLKKFGSPEEFFSRAKLVIDSPDPLTLNFSLLIDDKVAGMVVFNILEEEDNCRPNPYQNKKTFMLINAARSEAFKGFGVGKLVSFLAVCYVNNIGGTVTSDRNTSDKAGKQLVDSLKMIGAEQSEEFDYVGYIANKLKNFFFDRNGEFKATAELAWMAPKSNKTGIASLTKGIHNDRLERQFSKSFPELVKKVLNHLEPLTTQNNDDCKPSKNIIVADRLGFDALFYSADNISKIPEFLEKLLTMSSQQIQDFFSSDERVQGYTFTLPDMMIKAGIEIIKAIDQTADLSDEEKEEISKSATNMFVDVYGKEIGKRGRAVN